MTLYVKSRQLSNSTSHYQSCHTIVTYCRLMYACSIQHLHKTKGIMRGGSHPQLIGYPSSMHAYIIMYNGSQLNEQKMQQEVGKNSGCFDLEGLHLLGLRRPLVLKHSESFT